jgi:hypothetical protein
MLNVTTQRCSEMHRLSIVAHWTKSGPEGAGVRVTVGAGVALAVGVTVAVSVTAVVAV